MLDSTFEHPTSSHVPSRDDSIQNFLNELPTLTVASAPNYELASKYSPPQSAKVTYCQLGRGSIISVPKSWSYDSSKDSLLVSIYSFLKTFMSASGNSQGAIDNRIEQAMDLVKSHLMNAVRSEVEELKEKIVGLEIKIDHLQNENDILKTHAPTDVVNQLPQLAPTPPQAMMMGPPPMSGLNLAAPQPVMMSAPANGMHGPAQGPPSQGGAPTNGHTHPQTNGGTTQN